MRSPSRSRLRGWLPELAILASAALCGAPVCAAADASAATAGDVPAKFVPQTAGFDYDKRAAMIPMRDGVRLRTFILVPKGAHDAPLLLVRTPYNAAERVSRIASPHLVAVVPPMLETAAETGYIIVYQDVRGKYGSEGDYVMNRPLQGPLNPTGVDHATDAYDTIQWLVTHVPESNGRVGTIGGSYEGFTAVMSTVHPHPALKVAVPFAPMIDCWFDDCFHNGAFRQDGTLDYVYEQEATRANDESWWSGQRDTYQAYLEAGSAGAVAAAHGMEQLGFWRDLLAHPAYDAYWQQQAVDKLLAHEPLRVPMLIVCGLFDEEDIYGGPALYAALAPQDPDGRLVHLVLGPWTHQQGRAEGRGIGPIRFDGDTAGKFRREVMQPFLDHYLRDGPDPHVPRVLAYETGADRWHRYDRWPQSCAAGCPQRSRRLYLHTGGQLDFDPPAAAAAPTQRVVPAQAAAIAVAFDEYRSDPAKPVPYRASRPTLLQYGPDSTWDQWLVDDQRNAGSRPDVLVYRTAPLTRPLRLAGNPVAELFASTSGTDSDWVVKLIDVWPDQVPAQPELGGYQQMLSADIFRGRYREDLAVAHPLVPNRVLPYRFRLPNTSHTFLPGHRVMVQIQSSWFPLYDRNPQTFVPNIMLAQSQDFRIATQRIWHTAAAPSAIDLPVVGPAKAGDDADGGPDSLLTAPRRSGMAE